MLPLKRRKLPSPSTGSTAGTNDGPEVPCRFPEIVLFFLERKMGSSRRTFLSELGKKNGFKVESQLSSSVTHVLCENNSADEVRAWLNTQLTVPTSLHLLHVHWFTESLRAGRPVEILDRHTLQGQMEEEEKEEETCSFTVPNYACQRRTQLHHHNPSLSDALTLLAENAELNEDDGRAVAFRRAAAVLKALPAEVTSVSQLKGLPCLGEHSLRVIKDVLKDGSCSEVETTKHSQRFNALKVLTGIFGVGVKTADRWIRDGIFNLQQLRESQTTLNRAQQAGLDHYEDLNQPVTRADADSITEIVQEAVSSLFPGAQVTLTGGFRRGKMTGHDVDFLLTHPEEGREEGLMDKVVSWLDSQGLLLYQKTSRNSYLESRDGPGRPSSNMDRFERCFAIFKLSRGQTSPPAGHQWRAVRVDLVVTPISQFAFALLGWTGSKLFERELRRWAGHEKAMSLSSHALFDKTQKRYLRASSEEEIFTHLGLSFIPPSQRNA
ncbi:DNA-directed DNA/RNA polymerase mu [Gouania willdenowi]|uniref:DNA-directed DNA/RNA polymerase mu n=1 Tax=Gouania willdenowi TaxID=441366 RepID=A0A8C5EGQ5_GOUWI|nr:DNA-directed DNA/RNA polymerase mu [Gouania willdenowi]